MMTRLLGKRNTTLAAVSAALLLSACGGGAEEPGAPAAVEDPTGSTPTGDEETSSPTEATTPREMRDVTFATAAQNPLPLFMNIEIGEELGFYAEEGIRPTFTHTGGNAAVTSQLDQGRAQVAVGVPSFQLTYAAEGNELPAVNYYEYTYPMKWDIVVASDSDIESISDLDGRTLGLISLGTADELVAKEWLSLSDVDPSNVNLQVVGNGTPAGAAMEQGDIDAFLAWDTTLGQFDVAGIDYRTLDRPQGLRQVGGFYIQSTPEVLENDRDLAVGFARAVAKGTVFALENPQAAAAIYLEMHPQDVGELSFNDAVDNLVEILQYRMANWEPYDDVAMGHISEEEWQNELEFAGVADQISDVDQFFTNELIEEINDFDAEAIRQMARDYEWQQ